MRGGLSSPTLGHDEDRRLVLLIRSTSAWGQARERNRPSRSRQNPVVRLLSVLVSLLLQDVWRYLHWEYVPAPRWVGCRLWDWSYKEFTNMVRRAAWTALAVRRTVPANRPPDERFSR
jgi:hypothetical protein